MNEIHESRSLYCTLTDDEILARSAELAQVVCEYSDIEAVKKAEASAHKEKLDALRGRERELAKEIHTRTEMREVECVVRMDPIRGCVETVRLDTGEMIEERPMSDEERQLALDMPIPFIETQKAKRKRKERVETMLLEPDDGSAA